MRSRSGDGVTNPALQRLLLLAVTCGVLAALVYLAMVGTTAGQVVDNAAVAGQTLESPAVADQANSLLDVISWTTLPLLLLGVAAVAAARRRWLLAVSLLVIMVTSIAGAELLRHIVFGRPELQRSTVLGDQGNTFPSGHAAIGMAIAIGLVAAAPVRIRAAASLLGALIAVTTGMGVLTAAWHRLSDALGGELVATSLMALGIALFVAWRGVRPIRRRGTPVPLAILMGLGVVMACIGAFGLLVVTHNSGGIADDQRMAGAYQFARALVYGVAVLPLAMLAELLTQVELEAAR